MPYSDLVDGCSWSPNYYSGRRDVTRITPHHTACVADAWTIASMFKPTSRQASCNYAIGNDGSLVCVVDESDTAWTSSSWENDSLAITVEISDCDYDWNISDEALETYINLCVDLIRRYPSLGGEYNYTGDTSGNITLHKWFAATACPGPYLEAWSTQKMIEEEVNRRVKGEEMITKNDANEIWAFDNWGDQEGALAGTAWKNLLDTNLKAQQIEKDLKETNTSVKEISEKLDSLSVKVGKIEFSQDQSQAAVDIEKIGELFAQLGELLSSKE